MSEFANRQEVFNHVWNHFVVNGKPLGFDLNDGGCVYGSRDIGCAIGICLSNKLCQKLDNLNLGSILDIIKSENMTYLDKIMEFFPDDVDGGFLSELQSAHDQAAMNQPRHKIKSELEKFAENNRLTIPE